MRLSRREQRHIRLALALAIDYEESVLDAWRHVPEKDKRDVVKQTQRNIDRFKKLQGKFHKEQRKSYSP